MPWPWDWYIDLLFGWFFFMVKAVKVGKYAMTMDGNGWMVKRSWKNPECLFDQLPSSLINSHEAWNMLFSVLEQVKIWTPTCQHIPKPRHQILMAHCCWVRHVNKCRWNRRIPRNWDTKNEHPHHWISGSSCKKCVMFVLCDATWTNVISHRFCWYCQFLNLSIDVIDD